MLVLGGGVAGTIAALAAKEAGAEVALVRAAPGASALASGLVEVAADPLGRALPAIDVARALAERLPGHPYRTLRASLPLLPAALDLLVGRLPDLFAPLDPSLFATPLGALRSAVGAQRSQAAGALRPGVTVAVVGFRDDPGQFDAGVVAAGLLELGVSAKALWCDYLDRRELIGVSPFALAALLDRASESRRLGESIGRVLPEAPGSEHAQLPPLVGLERPAEALAEVGRAAGIAVGEISASVPSVPGIRLDRALEAALTRGGIERRQGEVRGIERGK
ncbi:MAG: FAD-binding protein, partial [Deltaproteobacteria bacterium]